MTTYEFERAAKRLVIHETQYEYDEDYQIEDISVVWMAHLLGNKKCILIDNGENLRLYEVTYNANKNEMYLDVYFKHSNRRVDETGVEELLALDIPEQKVSIDDPGMLF